MPSIPSTADPMTRLFDPLPIGAITLPSRIVMAPMTRSRSTQPGDVPNALMGAYYAQRATAGLIVSEATQISPQGKGYSFTPGIHTDAQVAGWRQVTDAVHTAGGRIVLQLWHVGRKSHGVFHADGLPVAPSAIAPGSQVWVSGDALQLQLRQCPSAGHEEGRRHRHGCREEGRQGRAGREEDRREEGRREGLIAPRRTARKAPPRRGFRVSGVASEDFRARRAPARVRAGRRRSRSRTAGPRGARNR